MDLTATLASSLLCSLPGSLLEGKNQLLLPLPTPHSSNGSSTT